MSPGAGRVPAGVCCRCGGELPELAQVAVEQGVCCVPCATCSRCGLLHERTWPVGPDGARVCPRCLTGTEQAALGIEPTVLPEPRVIEGLE